MGGIFRHTCGTIEGKTHRCGMEEGDQNVALAVPCFPGCHSRQPAFVSTERRPGRKIVQKIFTSVYIGNINIFAGLVVFRLVLRA